jgi:iron complex transport system ATP-binding protein
MLEVKSLYFRYNGHDVLHNVSLRIQPGEVLALIGPNGAGKSTLIRTISGVLAARQGSVTVDGREVSRLAPMQRARYMAVVPQARQLPGAFSVYQTVALGRTPYLGWLGKTGKSDDLAVQRALEQTQLAHLAERMVGSLSGGEQQRVLLARALAQETPLLLMDEPTTHLDLEHQTVLLNLVRGLAVKKGLAVLAALHDLNLASLYSDRVALIADGRIQAIGVPQQVLTGDQLSQVYHVPVQVVPHPQYGSPLVLPDGRRAL